MIRFFFLLFLIAYGTIALFSRSADLPQRYVLDVNQPHNLWMSGQVGLLTVGKTVYSLKLKDGAVVLSEVLKPGEGPGEVPEVVRFLYQMNEQIVATAFPKMFILDRDGKIIREERLKTQGWELCVWQGRCAGIDLNFSSMTGDCFVASVNGGDKKILFKRKLPNSAETVANMIIRPAMNLAMSPEGFFFADGQNALRVEHTDFNGKILDPLTWDVAGPQVDKRYKAFYQKLADKTFNDPDFPVKPIDFPDRLPAYHELLIQGHFFVFKTYHLDEGGIRYEVVTKGASSPVAVVLPHEIFGFWFESDRVWYITDEDDHFVLNVKAWSH